MLKLLGALFLAGGAAGYSFCICRDLKLRLVMLKELKYMYQLIQNEIRYTALPMPLIFENIWEKVKPPFGGMLRNIGRKTGPDQGEMLSEIWMREAGVVLEEVPFTKKQKESVVRFPESMGMMDKEGQAKAVQRRIEELEGWIFSQEKEGRQQQKVIMSMGIGAGLLLIILLL